MEVLDSLPRLAAYPLLCTTLLQGCFVLCVCGVWCVCVWCACVALYVCTSKHSLHHCILTSRTCFKKISAGLELAIQQVRMHMSRVVDVFQKPPVCCGHDFPFSQCPLQQLAISSQAQSFIDTKQIVSTGPFIFAQLEEVRTINLYCCI